MYLLSVFNCINVVRSLCATWCVTENLNMLHTSLTCISSEKIILSGFSGISYNL